jgi:hypothetical protein
MESSNAEKNDTKVSTPPGGQQTQRGRQENLAVGAVIEKIRK